ncbi:DUF4870 domain-containing protein [Kordia sp. YSTF-M3]|uniref:DUF4870 domain-containing protein n=1 Tax=Kordia aestuariivivens TaxID=2759037 RepID=A0ABR7Q5J7_9FLAO|nr:DUF4870 domain-containing protein [Kordia aestuariivivens]MBC8753793.1 DUF4870 domain-containing protein [Kordia aestuariivivens]
MDSAITKHQKNVATILHVATFSKYFFPFGNFILPLILWTMYKKEAEYIDHHGKEALNFQLSLFCYKVAGTLLTVPFFFMSGVQHLNTWDIFHFNTIRINFSNGFNIHNLSVIGIIIGVGYLLLFAVNITYTILAAMKANEGEKYRYPFTIRFIK